MEVDFRDLEINIKDEIIIYIETFIIIKIA